MLHDPPAAGETRFALQAKGGPRVRYGLTLGLLAVNVACFALAWGDLDSWVLFLAQNQERVLVAGEWWRLFTALWLHAGLLHLTSNMVGLLLFGISVEILLPRWQYLVVYVASGLAGSLGSLALSAPGTYSLGASGCIFGLLGAALFAGQRLTPQQLGIAVLYLAASLAVSSGPGIDTWAHLFGALAGLALGLFLTRKIRPPLRQVLRDLFQRPGPGPTALLPSRIFAPPGTPARSALCPFCRLRVPPDTRACPHCNRPLDFEDS